VRGFGAELKNASGQAFMHLYHPLKSLAPRDVVSRAIVDQMKKSGAPCVYLDLRPFDPHELRKHFPNICQRLDEEGIDVTKQMVPVVPAAHYICGGVETDLHGRTSIDRLYACGEVACTGIHGANRLASNSLLEGVVFSASAAEDSRAKLPFIDTPVLPRAERSIQLNPQVEDIVKDLRLRLQQAMWRDAGVIRDAGGLQRALQEIEQSRLQLAEVFATGQSVSIEFLELQNMLETASLIVTAALKRKESCGAHFRSDYREASVEMKA
jgi:L-aspartate oxidase